MHMMRQFLRVSLLWDYTGEQETVQQDDEEDYNLFLNIIFESHFMKFILLFVKKLYSLPKKIRKIDLVKTL